MIAMCDRGSWRGFHSRTINGTLAVMEQCTDCGAYRARAIEDCPFVQPTEGAQSDTDSEPLPDPESDEGSIWGPSSDDSTQSGW